MAKVHEIFDIFHQDCESLFLSAPKLVIVEAEPPVLVINTAGVAGRALRTIQLHMDNKGQNISEIRSLKVS